MDNLTPHCRGGLIVATTSLILAVLHSTGCTVVGLATGAIIDGTKSNTTVVESNYHEKIRKNKAIAVALTDGTRLEGTCGGLVSAPDSTYSTSFERSKLSSASSPKPGD